jgi:hypothetical protein
MDLPLEVHRLDQCLFHRRGLKMKNGSQKNEDTVGDSDLNRTVETKDDGLM